MQIMYEVEVKQLLAIICLKVMHELKTIRKFITHNRHLSVMLTAFVFFYQSLYLF